MDCKLNEQLNAYLDGELAAGEREAFDSHLLECAECARRVAEARRISGFLSAANSFEMRPERLDRIHRLLRRDPLLRFSEALMAIAAAIMLACGLCLLKSGGASDAASAGGWERIAITQRMDPPQGADSVDPVVQVPLREQP